MFRQSLFDAGTPHLSNTAISTTYNTHHQDRSTIEISKAFNTTQKSTPDSPLCRDELSSQVPARCAPRSKTLLSDQPSPPRHPSSDLPPLAHNNNGATTKRFLIITRIPEMSVQWIRRLLMLVLVSTEHNFQSPTLELLTSGEWQP